MHHFFLDTQVFHKRFLPKLHQLKHHIFYLMIDLDHLKDLNHTPLIRYNKFHIWSLYSKDYGYDKQGLHPQRFNQIRQTYQIPDGKIYCVTVPRFLGHSFNPVSFFLFYDKDAQLRAVLSEVHNTFKERHCYMCRHNDGRVILPEDILEAQKIFHVSPFFPVSGVYKFQFKDKSNRLNIKIDYYDKDSQRVLTTGIDACKENLSKFKLFMCAIRFPFISLKILLLIHYHAAILWYKKIQFFKKPPPPSRQISS